MKIENFSYRQGVAITPSDTANLPGGTARGLYTGAGGAIVLRMDDSAITLTLTGVPAGQILPLTTSRVLATGTTATGLIALY